MEDKELLKEFAIQASTFAKLSRFGLKQLNRIFLDYQR